MLTFPVLNVENMFMIASYYLLAHVQGSISNIYANTILYIPTPLPKVGPFLINTHKPVYYQEPNKLE